MIFDVIRRCAKRRVRPGISRMDREGYEQMGVFGIKMKLVKFPRAYKLGLV